MSIQLELFSIGNFPEFLQWHFSILTISTTFLENYNSLFYIGRNYDEIYLDLFYIHFKFKI